MRRWILGTLCVLLACTAWAGGNQNGIRKISEASMLVTGWIEVMPDGSVHQFTLDQQEKLPPVVVDLMQKAVPSWKFHLTDNISAIHRAKMSVRIVAKRVDDAHDSISIASTTFGEPNATPSDHVTYKNKLQPLYPPEAIRERFGCTVYLVVRVDRQGQVADAAVEQVNLDAYADERRMDRIRDLFSDAAINFAKRSTFNLPTTGNHVNDAYWTVRIPISYFIHGLTSPPSYGQWQAYIPGPHNAAPWLKDDPLASQSPDAVPPGSIADAHPSMQLINEPSGT